MNTRHRVETDQERPHERRGDTLASAVPVPRRALLGGLLALAVAPAAAALAQPRPPRHVRWVENGVERIRRALGRLPSAAQDRTARLELVATHLDPAFDLSMLLSRALGRYAAGLSQEEHRTLAAAVRLTVAHFVMFTIEREGARSVVYAAGSWDHLGGLVTAHGAPLPGAVSDHGTLAFYEVRNTRSGLRIVNVSNGEGDLERELTTTCGHMLTEGGGLANLIAALRERHAHTYPF